MISDLVIVILTALIFIVSMSLLFAWLDFKFGKMSRRDQ